MQFLARGREMPGYIAQLHAKAQIGFVDAIAPDGLAILHMAERRLHFDSSHSASPNHDLLDHAENHILRWEGHLQIELRKFRLAVRSQILITEAARDLKIAIQTADHQN